MKQINTKIQLRPINIFSIVMQQPKLECMSCRKVWIQTNAIEMEEVLNF